jgi:tripartite-type tricarboxylate transporter receptor subunit TctC
MKSRLLIMVCSAIAWMHALPAAAQAYPAKPIRVIVPFAAGSGLDNTVRLMGDRFQKITGQPLVLDNKGGAGGIIGNEAIAKAAPDGYTIGLTAINMLVINPHMYKDLPYDPIKSFAPITQVISTNHVLAVTGNVPATSLGEFVAWVKSNPGKVNIASNGAGTTPHLLAVLLNQNTGTDVTPIHYKGGGEAIKDFLGGHVQSIFGSPLQMLPHVPTGRAKILAITKAKRSDVLPNTPTFAELGFPNMVVDIWTAYIAPVGTPEPMIQKLYTEFARILAMPDVIKAMEADGQTIVASTPAEFGQMIRTELKRWEGVVKASGWKIQ